MSLAIISKNLENQKKIFQDICLTAQRAKLSFFNTDWAFKENGSIIDLELRYFHNSDEWEYFLMDIADIQWSKEEFQNGNF